METEIIAAILSVTFEPGFKFLIVFLRLILGKVRVDGFTRPRWENDIRYEFELKELLKGLGCKYRFSDVLRSNV